MTILKTFLAYLYTTFVPQTERVNAVLGEMTEDQKSNFVTTYLFRDAPLLARNTPEYTRVLSACKDVVTLHYNSPTFERMCQTYVRSVMPPSYYLVNSISHLLAEHNRDLPGSAAGNEGDRLLEVLRPQLVEASKITNPIKRRAAVRALIKEYVSDLPSDKAALLIELMLAAV